MKEFVSIISKFKIQTILREKDLPLPQQYNVSCLMDDINKEINLITKLKKLDVYNCIFKSLSSLKY